MQFSTSAVQWPDRDLEIPVKPVLDNSGEEHFCTKDPTAVKDDVNRLSSVLDAKHSKADSSEITGGVPDLSEPEQEQSLKLLTEHESLFDGTLG